MSFNPYKSWLKISGADGAPNHYDLLGLPCFEADVDRIRQAYRERYAHVRRYEVGDHGESAIRLMEELSKSLVLLTDPDKKAAYDKQLRESGERDVPARVSGHVLPTTDDAALQAVLPLPDGRLFTPTATEEATASQGVRLLWGAPRSAVFVGVAAVCTVVLIVLGGFGAWLGGRGTPLGDHAVVSDGVGWRDDLIADDATTRSHSGAGAASQPSSSSGRVGWSVQGEPLNTSQRQPDDVSVPAPTMQQPPAETPADGLQAFGGARLRDTPRTNAQSQSNLEPDKVTPEDMSAGALLPDTLADNTTVPSRIGQANASDNGPTARADTTAEGNAATAEAENPTAPTIAAGDPSNKSAQRVWIALDESYSVRAEYMGYHSRSVLLRRLDDNRKLTVPIEEFSERDRQWVHGQEGKRLDGVLREARRAIDVGDVGRARRLVMTDTVDEDIRAEFFAGLIAALKAQDPSEARKHFSKCVRRQPGHAPSLNNLACAEVRLGKASDALKNWRKALKLQPGLPEVHHNLRIAGGLVAKRRIQVGRTLLRDLSELTSKAPRSLGRGWQYLDFSSAAKSYVHYEFVDLWDGLEHSDARCMQCDGLQVVNCVVRQCKRGKIYVKQRRVIATGPGGAISSDRKVPTPCRTCRGTGRLRCPFCSGGVDRDL